MIIKGRQFERVEVEIPDEEVIEGIINLIKTKYSLRNVDGLKDGRMYEVVEYATSHTWTETEDRGRPTLEQVEALRAIEFLKGLKS